VENTIVLDLKAIKNLGGDARWRGVRLQTPTFRGSRALGVNPAAAAPVGLAAEELVFGSVGDRVPANNSRGLSRPHKTELAVAAMRSGRRRFQSQRGERTASS